jgi:hypothetical protein
MEKDKRNEGIEKAATSEYRTGNGRTATVLILTPYLSERLEVYKTKKQMAWQRTKGGYEPDNLAGTEQLMAGAIKVNLAAPQYSDGTGRKELSLTKLITLAIAGCTEPGEAETRRMRGSGNVIARYSIFYSGPSTYTGSNPGESGYSLDIPKNVETVKKMLTYEPLMGALIDRNEQGILSALEGLNSTLEEPILPTSYLKKALTEKNKSLEDEIKKQWEQAMQVLVSMEQEN